ncbi:RNA polymerase sigma-70 factor (ECF subfamily) [Balneicella halophila]|uniref:RNA polymerase sigma-70 factor (ECF subfamily) n=1 Tax=Balneicella halophila TaxID=1537566 RepID=A0A7L4UPF7_BALHA|nr:sigma-70 family RNA polymerase sigma factor [Balneicella halophila]PVX49943.1 RNA polymerase sigma-70 factor (ECF subfamily) [Balneicella halophila]
MTRKEYAKYLLPAVDNVLPMACRMLGCTSKAEDVVQEVMLSLWERRKEVHIKTSYKAFLYQSVRNKCLDTLKQNNKLNFEINKEYRDIATSTTDDFDTRDWITKCIRTLLELQQKVINMREIDGLEFYEISELLELKEAHVRVLLSRAKKTLQEILPKGLK